MWTQIYNDEAGENSIAEDGYGATIAQAHQCKLANLVYKCFLLIDVPSLLKAYTINVRSVLEYASVIWSQEQVQRRFTKRLPGYSHMSYHDRIHKMVLDSLELQRLKSDLVFAYKTLFGLVDVDKTEFFAVCNSLKV